MPNWHRAAHAIITAIGVDAVDAITFDRLGVGIGNLGYILRKMETFLVAVLLASISLAPWNRTCAAPVIYGAPQFLVEPITFAHGVLMATTPLMPSARIWRSVPQRRAVANVRSLRRGGSCWSACGWLPRQPGAAAAVDGGRAVITASPDAACGSAAEGRQWIVGIGIGPYFTYWLSSNRLMLYRPDLLRSMRPVFQRAGNAMRRSGQDRARAPACRRLGRNGQWARTAAPQAASRGGQFASVDGGAARARTVQQLLGDGAPALLEPVVLVLAAGAVSGRRIAGQGLYAEELNPWLLG
ncbi:hypothetical protein ACVBEG_26730 [Pseudomonas sp. GG8]